MVKSALSQEIAGHWVGLFPTRPNPGNSENPPGGTAEDPCGSDATVGGEPTTKRRHPFVTVCLP